MSDESNIVYLRGHPRAGGEGPPEPPAGAAPTTGGGLRAPRPKVKKVRLGLILLGLTLLAGVSTMFGMLMAVAADLPNLENRQIYNGARNSEILDVRNRRIGLITGKQNQIIVPYSQIARPMISAIISIEDKRFYDNRGIDFRGVGRALYQDVLERDSVQGGSTIAQQFVKNALQTQQERTLFQKLREATLAYHLTEKWSKQKILTEYLNAIYFGNGAYGVESAARTYFGTQNGQRVCGAPGLPNCAPRLRPDQAALLAGVVASPARWDPVTDPVAAKERRDLVLRNMLAQRYIDRPTYARSVLEAIPSKKDIQPPREESQAPYFTTWVKQQIVERFSAQKAFAGGLKIKTTLDIDLQQAAQQAVSENLQGVGPDAALVAIDNRTGGVAAMVGGQEDYNAKPFNLATQGQRQPGSAFKPFVLAEALKEGTSRDSVWESRKKEFTVPRSRGKESFVVNNYEDDYAGTTTLEKATAQSDNSVFAEMGIKLGPRKISRLSRRMGIRTPVSSNYAMVLGGLKEGVTPLDMAHAYQTLARRGLRVWGTLAAPRRGPVGVLSVPNEGGKEISRNRQREVRVLPSKVADTETQMLEGVIKSGTGTSAQIDGFAAGKTGTTENYGDAWFVGYNEFYTVAVWVGYSDRLQPMKTEYGGRPVAGGTFPADIWRTFMEKANAVLDQRGVLDRLTRDEPDRVLPNGVQASEYTPEPAGGIDSDGDGLPDDQTGEDGGAVVPDDQGGADESSSEGDTGGGDTGGGSTGDGSTDESGGGGTGGGDTGGGDGGDTGGGGTDSGTADEGGQ
ncbi:MAG: transglycosylase domain-containing protein [Solirubrobacteraceae bacterium]